VHGEDPPLRHQVVHDREDALLHFASVFRTEDHNLARFEIKVDAGFGGHSWGVSIRWESPAVEYDEIGLSKVYKLLFRRANEHRVHKQRVIRTRADNPHLYLCCRIPSGKSVETVNAVARVQVINRPLTVDREDIRL
jgi:hypothetical protein